MHVSRATLACVLVSSMLSVTFAGCTAEPGTDLILTPGEGPREGLVAHWSFDEGQGTAVTDSTLNGSDGIINGAQWATGPGGYALEFDGVDDYVDITEMPPVSTLGVGSLSLWFRADDIPSDNGILPIFYYGSRDSCANMFDASNQGIIIELGHSPVHYGSENLYFTIFADGCAFPSFCFDSRHAISEGEWHHFVAVVGEDFNTGYLDGVEMLDRRYNFGTAYYSQFFEDAASHEALWIGRGFWDAEPMYFDGAIDDVRIYDHALSAQEVSEFYQSSTGVPGHSR